MALINPLKRGDAHQQIHEFAGRLRRSIACLNDHARATASGWTKIASDDQWLVEIKRSPVTGLQIDASPGGIGLQTCNFAEVLNIAATAGRLLDALNWVQQPDNLLADTYISCCHPGHTSGGHDLELSTAVGLIAIFEVSDVVDRRDSNRKEAKDLEKLREAGQHVRKFLVTSRELGNAIQERNNYREVYSAAAIQQGTTLILELNPAEPRQ